MDAIEGQLRPLIPLMLGYGISAQEVGQIFKSLYLEALAQNLQDQGRPATFARLALMAGLPRAEVEALRDKRHEKARLRARAIDKVDQLARLLTLWHDDTRFSTPYGAPLDLSLKPERGFKTFSEVVEAAVPGFDASVALDELLAARAVEVHADKFVRCISRVFFPAGTDVSRIVRLGQQMAAVTNTMVHNLIRGPEIPPRYERQILTGGPVTDEFEKAAEKHLRASFQEQLEQLDRWWETTEAETKDPTGSRYGLAVFFFKELRVREIEIQQDSAANAN